MNLISIQFFYFKIFIIFIDLIEPNDRNENDDDDKEETVRRITTPTRPRLVKVDRFFTEINGEPANVEQFGIFRPSSSKAPKQVRTGKNVVSRPIVNESELEWSQDENSSPSKTPFYFNDDYVCIQMKTKDYKAYEEYLKNHF